MRHMKRLLILLPVVVALWACGTNSAERNNAGNDRYENGDYVAALAAYQAAQVADPDRPEFYYNAASALIEVGETEKAIEALNQVLKSEDESLVARAYYSMGNIYFDQADYAEAVNAYRETLLREPDDADARHNLELARLYMVPPTPTAIERKVEPEEGDTDREATPTDNPGGFDGPTATPPPVENPPDPKAQPTVGPGDIGQANSPTTPIPIEDGPFEIEDAIQLLDAVKHDQETIRGYLHEPATPRPPLEKDW